MSKLIMVVNDTQEVLQLFEDILTEEGYEVILHGNQTRTLEMVKEVKPDLVIVDQLITNEAPGWQLIQKMKMDAQTAKIPIVVCSAALDILRQLEGHLKGKNIEVVLKPFDIDELLKAAENALASAENPKGLKDNGQGSGKKLPNKNGIAEDLMQKL